MGNKSRIGIIGRGNVGSALEKGLVRAGYEVRAIEKADGVRELAAWAEVAIVAVPFGAIDDVVRNASTGLAGKTVIDATNALDEKMNLAVGFTTSGAEELQKKLPSAKVVKAFNTVFAQHMSSGRIGDNALSVFAAGDDEKARKQVLALATDIGFDAIDGGPLKNARYLESLGYFNIQLGYVLGNGAQIGFKLVRG